MTASTMISTFAVLWAFNHYFQSYGALSIVKINAAWFHVRERGSIHRRKIFGIMIQSGRFLLPSLRRHSSSACLCRGNGAFWVPSLILVVMFFANLRYVEDSRPPLPVSNFAPAKIPSTKIRPKRRSASCSKSFLRRRPRG